MLSLSNLISKANQRDDDDDVVVFVVVAANVGAGTMQIAYVAILTFCSFNFIDYHSLPFLRACTS